MRSPLVRLVSGSLPLLIVLTTCGCGGGQEYEGPRRSAVSGKVTHNDVPVESGSIALIAESDTGRSTTWSIENGAYSIPEASGPTLGVYRVEIKSTVTKPHPSGDEDQSTTEQVLPAEFNTESTLTITIDGPKVEKDFHLKSK